VLLIVTFRPELQPPALVEAILPAIRRAHRDAG
jgi:hypothetical protein